MGLSAEIEKIKNQPIQEQFDKLSSTAKGLDSTEATRRLDEFGYNEISEKKVHPVRKFFGYFYGPIPLMIEFALILSALINHWEDFAIILILLIANALIGFWHGYKAENAVDLLKQNLALNARVLRDNKWIEIASKKLVPGDVLRIRYGDIIPADIKLFGDQSLQINESALTGESLPVEKGDGDVAFSSSYVNQGESNGLVITTGEKTFFGKTAKLVELGKTESHFQKALRKIGNYLILFAVVLIGIIFAVSFLRQQSFVDTLQFSLVLAIASIPVALPAVLSVSMAIGSMTLAKKKAIVSKLTAIEELASIDVLCIDKTGTLTQNKLVVGDVKPIQGFTTRDVLLSGFLCSKEEDYDPIDNAVIKKASSDAEVVNELKNYHVESFTPFDPVIKRSESVSKTSNGTVKFTKGAPQSILALASNKEDIASEVDDVVDSFASLGYRSIGVAKKYFEDNWQFLGIISLFDPPRDDAASTIQKAFSLGVAIKMVTGDHLAIAKQIANKLGLGEKIFAASSVLEEKNPDSNTVIEDADGFAQVFPEHKYNIVESLQNSNHIVGMTGDGANDAPALKKADVGIAVANSTDVAKSSADIILTDFGISVIVDAIKESRKIFQRMKNYAIYRMGETIRILLFLTASIVYFDFYPISPIMIVLLALLNDLPIMTIALDKVRYSLKPERWNMKDILKVATILGIVGVFSSFILLTIGKEIFMLSNETMQSLIYLKLSVAGHLFLFVARTKGNFWTVRPGIPLLFAVLSTQTIATLITVYGIFIPPIGWGLAIFVWGYSLAWFFATDFAKIVLYKFIKI
ncbi:MAG: plasma-membrane proton-efflux P-type ATPase [Nitrosopumilaceae archaeon]